MALNKVIEFQITVIVAKDKSCTFIYVRVQCVMIGPLQQWIRLNIV